MELIELQENFVEELLQSFNSSWDKVMLSYEHYPCEGSYLESYDAKFYQGSIPHQFDLSLEAMDVLVKIKEKMGEAGKRRWTWCTFTLDNSGKYDFDFYYDIPPITKNLLEKGGGL